MSCSPLNFIGKCRGIKIFTDDSLKKDEYYLAVGKDILAGILNNSDKFAIIYNAEKVVDLASGKDNKKKGRRGHEKKQKS